MTLNAFVRSEGFRGFETIRELRGHRSNVPNRQGVYVVFAGNTHHHFAKSGGPKFKETMRSRIARLLSPGYGKTNGHVGGKLWTWPDPEAAVVCWKTIVVGDPRSIRNALKLRWAACQK